MATVLPIALAGIQAGSSILSGIEQSNQLKFQARQQEQQARLENLRAKETANQLRRQLTEDLASANAAFAARGVTTTSGTARSAQIRSTVNATRDINAALFGGRANDSQLRTDAANSRQQSSSALVSGFTRAAKPTSTLLEGLK